MRLDEAVFVLARPKVPTMPTRRAFVVAGCTFAAGMLVGGACGYSAGVAAGADAAAGEPTAAELPKSGDAELDALRALAVQAPIDELMRYALPFLELVNDSYPKDAVLWRGVDRIADALLDGYQARGRQLLSRAVAQFIERGDAQLASPRMHKVAPLRRIQ